LSMRKLFSTIFGLVVSASPLLVNAQMTEPAAREQALNVVRTELHLGLNKFLQARRDETLEQSLATAVARPSWSEFIYKVSEDGDEIKEHAVVHHITTDGDPTFTVAINPRSGSLHRIQGFKDSLAEFNKLMTEANVKVLTSDQAEAVAGFYREVNPQRASLVPLSSLLDLKQAAERHCQAFPFNPNEKNFEAWWRRAKPLYADVPFRQTAVRSGSDYLVEWIVLSSDAKGNCGGTPLRARLTVNSNAHVDEPTFAPIQKVIARPTKPTCSDCRSAIPMEHFDKAGGSFLAPALLALSRLSTHYPLFTTHFLLGTSAPGVRRVEHRMVMGCRIPCGFQGCGL